MPAMRHIPIIAAGLALISLFAATADAQSNRATFPQNFDQYVLYATYDRGSSKEEAFATPETLAIAKSGQPLPPGTRLVLGIWSNNTLTDYFVMEKGVGWGADFTPEQRTGDWHFQQFAPNRQVRRTAIAGRCQSCHGSQASNDFMFTTDRMRSYLP
jgi:hypothetical protein